MSRPIYEPSLQRTDRRLAYGNDQLFRRPAPTSDAGVTELVSVRGSAAYPITVNNNTWTDIGAVNWSSVYEQGNGNHIHVATAFNPDRIQIYSDAVFTFSGCIEWGAGAFTATRRLRVGPSGDYFPEGSGINEIDLGEEGTNNTFGVTFMSNFGGVNPEVMTIEVWQDSGSSKTVTGDTSFLLVLIGLITA